MNKKVINLEQRIFWLSHTYKLYHSRLLREQTQIAYTLTKFVSWHTVYKMLKQKF